MSLALAVGLLFGAGLWYLRKAHTAAAARSTVQQRSAPPVARLRVSPRTGGAPGSAAPSSDRAHRARCAANFRLIASALQSYANGHDWRYPDRLEDLVQAGLLPADALACPADAAGGDGSPSYVYTGKRLTFPLDPDAVLLHERSAPHDAGDARAAENGMHVLMADGRVRLIPAREAGPLLAAAPANSAHSAPVPAPATRPADASFEQQSDSR
jgi:hypothetical protein